MTRWQTAARRRANNAAMSDASDADRLEQEIPVHGEDDEPDSRRPHTEDPEIPVEDALEQAQAEPVDDEAYD